MITGDRSNRQVTLVLLGLTGVLAYVTFQWGGVVRIGRYEYLLVVGLLAIVWSLGRSGGEWSSLPGRTVRWTAALLPAYVLLQVVPLPMAVLRVLSPARAAGVDALGPIGARMRFASLSVFPAGTFQYFLLVCAYLVIFLLTCELTWHFRGRLWLAVWPILGIAALEAGLGLWQYFDGNSDQARRGTFANHNHFAGFLEMLLPYAVMYPVAVLNRAGLQLRSSMKTAIAACAVWAIAATVFTGIVYSFSRMGFLSTLFSLFVMGVIGLGVRQLNSSALSRRRQLGAIAVVVTLVLVSFAFLPPDKLIQRFANFVSADGLTYEGRSGLWIETIPLIRAYSVFGCGLGGYETAFSRFKKSGVQITDDFVHNDYLQLLVELGFIGFVICIALASSIVRLAARAAVKSSDPEARYFGIACLGALAAIALHSLADFNLYIPANAMLLAWISGMTMSIEMPEAKVIAGKQFEVTDATTVEPAEIGAHEKIYG
jgi:putative inorganic carbon (HCO3(-)) transporter